MAEGTRIHDLPSEQKPREKMAAFGASALSNQELLAIFLRTGTQGASAIEIGNQLIRKHGGLVALSRLDLKELCKEHGLGLAKACQLQAAFELGKRAATESGTTTLFDDAEAIYQFLAPQLAHLSTEHLVVMSLRSNGALVRKHLISQGTSNQTLASPREILRPVLIDQTSHFVIAHNHPSGTITPSGADIRLTEDIKKAAQYVDLTLLDHMIIGRPTEGTAGYFSFAENGRL